MADSNWIKLNRKIWDNFIWNFEKPQYAMAWIDLLLMANYKDKQIMFNGKVMTIQRGSFVTSMVKLSERWSMNRRTVKGFLDVLQDSGMITYTTSKKCTTIFVTNYLIYQGFAGSEHEGTAQPSTQLTAQPSTQLTAQPSTHNIRRLKKVKESEEGKEIMVSHETITGEDVQRVIEEWNKLGLSKILKIAPNTTRYTLLCDRAKEYGVDMVLEAIRKVGQTDFLKGGGEKGWRATFDWLIQDEKFTKVLGGDYDRKPQAPSSGSGRREMVPEWMARERQADLAKRDMEYIQNLIAQDRAQEQQPKPTVGNDPAVAEKAEQLKKRLQKTNDTRKEMPDADGKES